MKQQNKKFLLSLGLVISLLSQAMPLSAQQSERQTTFTEEFNNLDKINVVKALWQKGNISEFPELAEKIFGSDVSQATEALDENSEQLFLSVIETSSRKAEQSLDEQIIKRREKPKTKPIIAPVEKTKPVIKPKSKKVSFNNPTKFAWRQFAFGFQPFRRQDEKPEIKMTETDKEIKAEGTDKKSFETKDAKGTRTEKAETKYIKDGKTFGMEIKSTQIIEAVSKTDGKSFRKEFSMVWGADVAACPDINGVSAGTGKAKVISKTIYTENGETVTMSSEFDLQAKLTGQVNDQAEMTHYDLQIDAYTTNSGYEDALRRNLIKEIKIKDGRYGIHYDISGNTIEVSDGQYGGYRKPAEMGKDTGRKLTPMSDSETKIVASAFGPMVPSIWISANEMYKSAEKNWKNYGCVEVVSKVSKTTLKPGEEITISAESVHKADGSKINAELVAEAYQAQLTPESQRATPGAKFIFTQEGEENSSFHVKSISKRGIGEGDIEFQVKKEKEETEVIGAWSGTITAERKRHEEKDKRSGANLAENGGFMETLTKVQLRLTNRRDTSADAPNAFFGQLTGEQQYVDFEYDRYKVDEGYCGPNAVPYKGPKEITRTSKTTADINKETHVYVSFDQTNGSINFALPEINGRTVHSYVHQSPCAEHDRVNTNEAIDENAPLPGGSFSFTFPINPTQKLIKGSITVREEDGSTTTYTWELTRIG